MQKRHMRIEKSVLILPLIVVLASINLPLLQAQPSSAPANSNAPGIPPFAEQLAEYRKVPLLEPETHKTVDGKPLTPAQRSNVDKASKLLEECNKARKSGDFDAGQKKALEAMKIFAEVLGPAHYLTVYSIAQEKTLRRYFQSPPDELNLLSESDKLMERAEAALDKCEYANAVSLASRAAGMREKVIGRGHHELGDCYRVVGAAQTELVAFDDAEKSLDKALDVTEKAFGKGHPVTAKVLDRQAWLFFNKGDTAKALASEQTAVRTYGLTCGDTLDAAEAIDNYGSILFMRGDPNEALRQKLRSLVIREKLAGPDSKESATSYSNLAWVYSRMGAGDEAVPLRRRALAIFEKELGPDHPYTSTETVTLGVTLQNLGKVNDAIELYQRAVGRDEKRTEPVDARVVSRIASLGVAYFEADRRDEADKTLQSAIEKAQIVKKAGNPSGAASEVKQIGDIYHAYRMFDAAVKASELACAWDTETDNNTEAAILRRQQLIVLWQAVGRDKEAKDLIDKTLPIAIKLFGSGERKMTSLLMASTRANERLGNWQQAEQNCNQVLRISEMKVGAESKDNAIALREMGKIYLSQKKMDLAKFSLDESKRITEKYAEFEPVEMIRLQLEYSGLQFAQDDRAGGMKTLRESLATCRKLAEKTKNPHMDGVLASTLKRLVDALKNETGAADKDALRSELIQTLNRLQSAKALDAENRAWLQELGVKG